MSEFVRLHVDHDHRFDRVKFQLCKHNGRWVAQGSIGKWTVWGEGDTKPEARKQAKLQLRRLSVRGAICWADNSALQKFRDDADRMEAASQYIRKFNSRMGLC